MAKKNTPKTETPPPEAKGRKKKGEESTPEPPKRSGKAVVAANASWTGKLPGNLLHEHAQKQKWEKVQYDMRRGKGGFIATTILSWKNPKTQEMVVLRFEPKTALVTGQETALEARHFAATYALHRICFEKNIHMVLPTNHKNLWLDLEKERKEMLKLNPGKHRQTYNAEPFVVHLERKKEDERKEKERAAQQNSEEKQQKPTVAISSASFPRKAWEEATHIDLHPENRSLIEATLKHHVSWTMDEISAPNPDYTPSLTKLGFRSMHIDEALQYTATFTDTLEWLLFHVPEDDLPAFFAKNSKDSNVSVKKVGQNLQLEYAVARMTESGWSRDEVVHALGSGDEVYATVALFNELAGGDVDTTELDESMELWTEEVESLSVIYDELRVSQETDPRIVEISLSPHHLAPGLLLLRAFKSPGYPSTLAGFQLIVGDKSFRLASYIKLSILKQLGTFLALSGYLGDCYIYSAVDWLEENIHRIIENPGPLFDPVVAEKQERALGSTKKHVKHVPAAKPLSRAQVQARTQEYQTRLASAAMKLSLASRAKLPAWQKRQQLVEVISANQVTVVTGETGSGKSTQIVQFILDELMARGELDSSIMCTQPRRISTIGLAERISDERCDRCGNETGYIIRGENKTNTNTRITFVTTGVLLRMIQGMLSGKSSGSFFDRIGYIFIDEVHERSIDSDFLLIILKSIMAKFPRLKIVLMSATIDVNIFRDFFGVPLNHIHIEGRTFPIQDYYLNDVLGDLNFTITNHHDEVLTPKADSPFFQAGNINYELVSKLVGHIDRRLTAEGNTGSILIFLPGIMEITTCIRAIERDFRGASLLLPLHSALSSQEQKKVFNFPPKGTRKIVVSTNVAETSITIPDVVVVIDSGRSKSMFFDAQSGATKLVENWCSRAEVGQRRGRSGRITNGNCYKMYTRETESQMLAQPVPEILRTRLESIYLVVKAMGIHNVTAFLNSGLDAPDYRSLQKAHQTLVEIGALANDKITNMGTYLSLLPTDLASGKLLIFGTIFGCLDACLTLASMSSNGSPFINDFLQKEKVKAVQMEFSEGRGDLIAVVNAYKKYAEVQKQGAGAVKRWLKDNFLSYLTMKEIGSTRAQYVSILQDIGFVPFKYSPGKATALDRNSRNYNVINAIVTSAFFPNLARVQRPDPKFFNSAVGAVAKDPDARQTKLWIRNEKYMTEILSMNDSRELPATRAFCHPSSTLFATSENAIFDKKEDIPMREDGIPDFDYLQSKRDQFDFTPSAPSSKYPLFKSSFVVYRGSHHTTKLYLRDITPATTLVVLLFGGIINYDLTGLSQGKTSPGIVMDGWLPIRTWCKNGVLIKKLRQMLDEVIREKLEAPSYDAAGENSVGDDPIVVALHRFL
ncbi:hypothetical protein BABINDRAFT_178978 [Babjeviella inositovora NRRL Y-12698]|uniref:RNA helicase n=1 Tax=Babjeviella inositovora NRRL Y-12698 TaxID=984486 RepID=A0A1E3QZC3_9ASCO|nr:uncharacterized protein BABINDRAFT_178978 [Babjeviella inositovora NRRL Y-12698]ODQ82904.1 hypothetical protein BABINDRAFT_178978 [Babjeviella inositovora NRRL Y-12698]